MNERALRIGLLGFAAGVMARSFFNFGFSFALFFLVISGALYLLGKLEAPPAAGGALFALFIFAAGLGMLRYDLSELHKSNPVLDRHLNQRVSVEGVIVDEPDERETSVRLTVRLDSLLSVEKADFFETKVLVVADLYPKFKYGDRLTISGLLARPKNFSDAGGKIFDYQSYLAKEGIYYQITRPQLGLIKSGEGNSIVSKLFNFKQAFLASVSSNIPEPHASLLGGLVVGAKQSLGKNLLDDFRKAGVIHIVVLSGYNITIVAEAIIKFFSFLPLLLGQTLGALGIILFAIMTGASATVVRASLMALLVILAKSTSRKYDITRALLFAGFLMVLQNPKILVFDSSFQLSFMSTLALIYVSPLLEKYFLFVTEKFALRSVVVATLSTQIFVLPILLYKMGELSVVALPVNLLILSVIPATMLFGFVAGMVGMLLTILAFPTAFVAYGLLDYIFRIVEFFSHLPFASLAVNYFPFWFAVLIYVFYFLIYLKLRNKAGGAASAPPAEKIQVNFSEPF